MSMFCYQCEQTAKGTGCTAFGVCGKDPETAALQDLVIHQAKGIARYAHRARAFDVKDREVPYQEGARLVERWPGAELMSTIGLGHVRILRAPAVVDKAVGFLDLDAEEVSASSQLHFKAVTEMTHGECTLKPCSSGKEPCQSRPQFAP